jgi:hypothetical protein
MAAVVVTDSLDWKLHGFDLTSEHALTVGVPSPWVLALHGAAGMVLALKRWEDRANWDSVRKHRSVVECPYEQHI